MLVIKDTIDFSSEKPAVITLGKFDGLHLGHQALIHRVLDKTGERLRSGSFPRSIVFRLSAASVSLLTDEERRIMLEDMGVHTLIECPFVPEIIQMEPETFVRDVLVDSLKAVHLVVGDDFRFGYRRRGDAAMLVELGKRLGFTVDVVPKVKMDGDPVSSTRIRKALEEGRMDEVSRLLGYTYFVTGRIIHGRQVGRTIGFPTTNLIPGKGKLLPPNGVYAARVTVDGEVFAGITNIGTKPTVDGHFVGVETYLYNCSEDLYGECQKVELLDFERPERKFPSVEDLKEQIMNDRRYGEAYFAGHPLNQE